MSLENGMIKQMPHEIPFAEEPIGLCAQTGLDIFEGDSYIEYNGDYILNEDEYLADYMRCQGILRD